MFVRIVVLFLAITPFIRIQAQSKPVDSVIVKVGAKSRIAVSIGDPADIPVLRHYDVDGLIEDLIRRVEDRQIQLPPAARYTVDSVVAAARSEADKALRELETEMEAMERDMPSDASRAEHLEKLRRISGTVERLAHLQARLAREQAERTISRKYRSYQWPDESEADDSEDQDEWDELTPSRGEHKRTRNSFNMDFGINNYLSGGKFVDGDNLPYTIRPMGSWYVAGNSTYRTRLANKFFLEWGLGVGFYNFKFLNDSIRLTKTNAAVTFAPDARAYDYRKSKLTAYYAQVFMVPVLDFGGNRNKPGLFDDRSSSSFRIGLGPYAGYRIDSYAKQDYKVDGDREVDRRHDNFYLNNLRYGLRLQVGFRDTELFFNYDMNELFTSGKGPALQAFSFGVSF